MSPTVFREGPYRAFFFSREESRMHVHVSCSDGDAEFWLDPIVALAHQTNGLSRKQLRETQTLVEDRRDEIERSWKKHLSATHCPSSPDQRQQRNPVE